MVEWDQSKDSNCSLLTLSVDQRNGFPDHVSMRTNQSPPVSSSIHLVNHQFVLGCGDHVVQGNETYIKCRDEWTLCKKFIELRSRKYPVCYHWLEYKVL
jgi:hypothetical protein